MQPVEFIPLSVAVIHPGYIDGRTLELARRDYKAKVEAMCVFYRKFFTSEQMTLVHSTIVWKPCGKNRWQMVMPKMVINLPKRQK